MPASDILHLPVVVHFAETLRPKRILDIGTGIGTYGFILRLWLDISHERLEREKWEMVIDGIEIFPQYRNPVWEYAYNNVIIGDARTLVDKLQSYDLVLCNDVLEHFEKSEARTLLSNLVDREQTVIATTPNVEYPQGAWGGNEAETHLCFLGSSDFPHLVCKKRAGVTTCFICSRRADHIEILKHTKFRYPTYTSQLSSMAKNRAKSMAKTALSAMTVRAP